MLMFPTMTGGVGGVAAPGMDADAAAYIAAMDTAPSSAIQGYIDDFIVGLKADAVWAKLTTGVIMALPTDQAARVDFVNPSNVYTKVGTPAFTADIGFAGVAQTNMLDTNLQGTDFTSNSFSMGAFQETPAESANAELCGWANSARIRWGPAPNSAVIYMCSSFEVPAGSASAADSFLAATITGTTMECFKNGSSLGTSTETADTTGQSSDLRVCGYPGQASTARLSFFFAGDYLTATEMGNLYARLATLLGNLGVI